MSKPKEEWWTSRKVETKVEDCCLCLNLDCSCVVIEPEIGLDNEVRLCHTCLENLTKLAREFKMARVKGAQLSNEERCSK